MRSFHSPRQTQPTLGRSVRGFTLVELLVVIGIIALLFGLSLAGVNLARARAQKIRVQSDLQMITTALEQYKKDFGDYPRFPDAATDVATQSTPGNGTWLDYSTDRGARLLCQALIAPGPAGQKLIAGSDVGQQTGYGEDGADGSGFRVRRTAAGGASNTSAVALAGKIWGPYLAPEKFKLESSQPNMQDAKILDIFGNPVLYFPALPGAPVVTLPNTFVTNSPPQSALAVKPLYNAYDNTLDTSNTTTPQYLLNRTSANAPGDLQDHTKDMQILLGDTSGNGSIDNGESATTTLPYLLWTAGPDGIFGRDKNGKTDDITNFDFPLGLKK